MSRLKFPQVKQNGNKDINFEGRETFMKKFVRKDNGSITLEAAMILPFFMLFIIFLATIIRIAIADMALYKAASETTEVIVAYSYPVEVATSTAEEIVNDKLQSLMPDELDLEQVKSWGQQALLFFGIDFAGTIESLFEQLTADLLTDIVKDKFEQAASDAFFDSSKLQVTNVEIPDIVGGTGGYFQIDVTYEVPISFPFVEKNIILSKTAAERVWTGP